MATAPTTRADQINVIEANKYIHAIALPAFIITRSGEVVCWNELANDFFKRSNLVMPPVLKLRNFTRYITTVDGEPYTQKNCPFQQMLKKPRIIAESRIEMDREGEKATFAASLGPVYHQDKMIAVLVTFRDITAELRRRRLQQTFIKVVGHELKQPLGLIKAHTYYLKRFLEKNRLESGAEYIQKIENQVTIIAQTFNDIVDATKFSLQTFSVAREPTDVMILLHKTVDELLTLHPHRKIYLPRSRINHFICNIDPVRTQQVFTNILTNALKYSSPNSPIKIGMRLVNSVVEISFIDKGKGISTKDLPNIFEPYYRGKSHSHKIKGLGLGLSFVKNIMIRQGGRVRVKTKLHKGSVFTLSFPLAA